MICRSCHLEHAPTLGCMVAARQEIYRLRERVQELESTRVATKPRVETRRVTSPRPGAKPPKRDRAAYMREYRQKTGSEKAPVSA